MAILQLPSDDDRAGTRLEGEAATQALQALGVDCGPWPLRTTPASSAPQLTYARELLALERRYGSRRIERVRTRRAAPARADEQIQDELCVVLEGRLHVGLRTPAGRGALSLEAGEWVALPPGLPHTLFERQEPGLEVLRLHPPAATPAGLPA